MITLQQLIESIDFSKATPCWDYEGFCNELGVDNNYNSDYSTFANRISEIPSMCGYVQILMLVSMPIHLIMNW